MLPPFRNTVAGIFEKCHPIFKEVDSNFEVVGSSYLFVVMAFPTLPPYSVRNPVTRERLIVQRRAHDADRIEKWSEHSRYFTTSDNRSNKENTWSSQKSYQNRYEVCGVFVTTTICKWWEL